MARTITAIQNTLIAQVQSNPTLGPLLTSTSKTAIWRLFTYVVAVCIWTLETLFDLHVKDVDERIAALKPHSLRWYVEKAKAYQHGYNLVAEADYYDNTGLDEVVVEASKIIQQASAVELERGLRIKVAKSVGADLGPLSTDQLNGFKAYMARIKDAGVRLDITSGNPDSLKLEVDCYYDPLLLNSQGHRLDGSGNTTVQDGVKEYLKNLPFNGLLELESLIDNQQAIPGVKIFHIKLAQAKYGALPFTSFAVQYLPDAGYLRFEQNDHLAINFLPYSEQ